MPTRGQGSENSRKIWFFHESLPILSPKKKKKRKNSIPTCPVPLPNKEPRRDQEHWNRGWGVAEEISTAQEGAGVFPRSKGRQR